MMEFITKYFISFASIEGGVQVNLGFALVVAILWITSWLCKRAYISFR